jgi:regulator of sirC expression with transglutaminase-like and TPR domain
MTKDILTELGKPEPEINLLRCTLLLARHDNPEIDIGAYLAHFRTMVADLKNDPEIAKGTPQAVTRLTRYLFEENGFHGARGDLSSLSDSYMNEVLDDREGLPITLSVLYIELARELGIQGVFGVALPGRFMVGWRDGPEGELLLIDAFENGKTITVEQAALAAHVGGHRADAAAAGVGAGVAAGAGEDLEERFTGRRAISICLSYLSFSVSISFLKSLTLDPPKKPAGS